MKYCWFIVIGLLLTLRMSPDVQAQSACPLPPNPNFAPCPLTVDRSTLQERDVDLDGQPDNFGSTGGFCGGTSSADCVGFATAEVVLDLVIPDPGRQSVTCTAPNLDVWFMGDSCVGCLSQGFGSATLPAGSTTDTTIKVVVADVNGDACVCGPLLTCTYDTEVICNDGADGDGDGLIDAADPDCCFDIDNDGFCGASDCDDEHPLVHQIPEAIQDLSLAKITSDTVLSWTTSQTTFHDVYSGSINELRSSQYSTTTCELDDGLGSTFNDARINPDPGDGYYYLVRSQNRCGDGGVVDSNLSPDPREALTDGSGVCPYCPDCVSTNCTLGNPTECRGDGCAYYDFGVSGCIPSGSGTQGDVCNTDSDCAPGFDCVDIVFSSSVCREWCTSSSDCDGTFVFCSSVFPQVIVDGISWGRCGG